MRLVTDIFEFSAKELPRWNTISISGYHMREAGATAAQELAFTLANGIAYVDAARARGLDVDAFAGRLSLLLCRLERALRGSGQVPRRAAHVGADHEGPLRRSRGAEHDVPLPRPDRRLEPDRAVGRQQRRAHDDRGTWPPCSVARRACTPTLGTRRWPCRAKAAARLALRTQQIIAHESGVADTVDPLAGSYFVETLTDQLEDAAQDYLDQIDAMGGAINAIDAGFQQRQIQEAAYRVQREVEEGDRIVVGVNRFRDDEVHTPDLQRIDPTAERDQVDRVRRLRASRDDDAWQRALDRLA